MQSPFNLDIWHRSIDLAVRIDALAAEIPGSRSPGIANQLRRASSSIPANIAEGAGQESPAQCARFISMAIGSAFELESHLVLLHKMCPDIADVLGTLDELQQVRRMMYTYRKHQLNRAQKARTPTR